MQKPHQTCMQPQANAAQPGHYHPSSNQQQMQQQQFPPQQQQIVTPHGNMTAAYSGPETSQTDLNLVPIQRQNPPPAHPNQQSQPPTHSHHDQMHPQTSFQTSVDVAASSQRRYNVPQTANSAGSQYIPAQDGQQPQLQGMLQHPSATSLAFQQQPVQQPQPAQAPLSSQQQQYSAAQPPQQQQFITGASSAAPHQHQHQHPQQQPFHPHHNHHQQLQGHPSIDQQSASHTALAQENAAVGGSHSATQPPHQHQQQQLSTIATSSYQQQQNPSSGAIHQRHISDAGAQEAAPTVHNNNVSSGSSTAASTTTSTTPLDKTKIIQVGLILQLMTSKGDVIPYSNQIITPFHSHEAPNINILLYYVVCSYNAGLHDSQAPCILVLLERLCQTAAEKGHPIFVNSFTIHRLILTTVLVTSKMFNDIYYTNQYIASVGGVTLQNINELERFYMSIIDWNLFITRDEFDFYEHGLLAFQQSEAAYAQASSPALIGMPRSAMQTFGPAAVATPAVVGDQHQHLSTAQHPHSPSASNLTMMHHQGGDTSMAAAASSSGGERADAPTATQQLQQSLQQQRSGNDDPQQRYDQATMQSEQQEQHLQHQQQMMGVLAMRGESGAATSNEVGGLHHSRIGGTISAISTGAALAGGIGTQPDQNHQHLPHMAHQLNQKHLVHQEQEQLMQDMHEAHNPAGGVQKLAQQQLSSVSHLTGFEAVEHAGVVKSAQQSSLFTSSSRLPSGSNEEAIMTAEQHQYQQQQQENFLRGATLQHHRAQQHHDTRHGSSHQSRGGISAAEEEHKSHHHHPQHLRMGGQEPPVATGSEAPNLYYHLHPASTSSASAAHQPLTVLQVGQRALNSDGATPEAQQLQQTYHTNQINHLQQHQEMTMQMPAGQYQQQLHHHHQHHRQLQQFEPETDDQPQNEMSHVTNLSMQAQQDLSPPRFDFHQIQMQIEAQQLQQQRWGPQGGQ